MFKYFTDEYLLGSKILLKIEKYGVDLRIAFLN